MRTCSHKLCCSHTSTYLHTLNSPRARVLNLPQTCCLQSERKHKDQSTTQPVLGAQILVYLLFSMQSPLLTNKMLQHNTYKELAKWVCLHACTSHSPAHKTHLCRSRALGQGRKEAAKRIKCVWVCSDVYDCFALFGFSTASTSVHGYLNGWVTTKTIGFVFNFLSFGWIFFILAGQVVTGPS